MLNGIIACDTPGMAGVLQEMCTGLEIVIKQVVETAYLAESIARSISTIRPDILFLELDLPNALAVATQVQSQSSKLKIVGVSKDPSIGRAARDAGVDQVLTTPFGEQEFFQTVRLAMSQQRLESSVFGFLPAKGGAGATVTALNASACLAQVWKRKVLLIEADFYSGILPLLLKFSPQGSVMEALDQSDKLDERSWSGLVTRRHEIDILAAWGARTAGQDSPLAFDRLLNFVRRRYDFVVVDLPVIVDRVAEVVSSHARNMYVVSTPEPICMDVARRRLRQLEARGARSSTLGVILNRVLGNPANVDIEEHARAVGGRISAVLPNDYLRVQAAIAAEKPVDPKSALGKAYRALAASMSGVEIAGRLTTPERSSGLRNLFSRLTGDAEKEAADPLERSVK